MTRFEGDGFDAPVVEGALWGALLVFAVVLLRRAPPGARWAWGLIAAGLALIVIDKAFDLHAVGHAFGRWIATALDPDNQLRGPNAIYRNVALATGLVGAGAIVVVLLRRDSDVGRAKLLCFCGLGVVGALLAARLAPGVEVFLADWLTKAIELCAWVLVSCGEWLGARPPRETGVVDGFVGP
jgi:hypothetical protein